MATQEQITLSNPLAVEHVGLQMVRDKRAKKEQKLIAELASALKLVKEAAGARPGAAEPEQGDKVISLNPQHQKEGPSNTSFEDAMAAMVMALQMLQVKIVGFENDQTKYTYEVSVAQRKAALYQLHKMEKKMKKMEKEKKAHKILGIFEKVAEVLVGTVMTILAVVLAQPELMIMAIMSFAAASGALSYATKGIADALEKDGCSPELAEILAGIIVTISVMILTIGMAPGADTEVATEESTDTATNAAEDATNVSNSTETQENTFQNLQNILKSDAPNSEKLSAIKKWVNIFNRMSMRKNLVLMNTMQSMAATNLASNGIAGIASLTGASKKKKKEIEEAVEIIMAITMIIVSLGSMDAVTDGAKANVKAGKVSTTRLGKVMNQIRSLIKTENLSESSAFMRLLDGTRIGGIIGQGATSGFQGLVTMFQAELEGDLATIKSNQQLLHTAMRMNTTEMKDEQSSDEQVQRSFRLGDQSMTALNKGIAAFANLFTSHSPV